MRISDSELNDAITRIANNNKWSFKNLLFTLRMMASHMKSFRENVRKQMIIQRIQRGRVGSEDRILQKKNLMLF